MDAKIASVTDDPGMERDITVPLNKKFSKKVADQNTKAMQVNSKYSDWSKK